MFVDFLAMSEKNCFYYECDSWNRAELPRDSKSSPLSFSISNSIGQNPLKITSHFYTRFAIFISDSTRLVRVNFYLF